MISNETHSCQMFNDYVAYPVDAMRTSFFCCCCASLLQQLQSVRAIFAFYQLDSGSDSRQYNEKQIIYTIICCRVITCVGAQNLINYTQRLRYRLWHSFLRWLYNSAYSTDWAAIQFIYECGVTTIFIAIERAHEHKFCLRNVECRV